MQKAGLAWQGEDLPGGGSQWRLGPGAHIWKGFKTGGLADFTGPAWLDGTKSKPEMVLNAADTANFIQLKDILSDILRGGIGSLAEAKGGDNYYNIDIQVDELSNDYDVDQVADHIKEIITNDAMYRNVNAIDYTR